jgi:signal peptidase II
MDRLSTPACRLWRHGARYRGIERHYSLPSGHATYAALVVGALWPLMGRRGRIGLVLYAALVGWSRIAAGMHFPADVLAGGYLD